MSVVNSLMQIKCQSANNLNILRYFHRNLAQRKTLHLSTQGQTWTGVSGTPAESKQKSQGHPVLRTSQSVCSYHQHALQSQGTRPSACKFAVIHMAMTEEDWDRIVNPNRLTEVEYRVHTAHIDAIQNGDEMYTDPITGLMVMTRLAHVTRGQCCGRVCRHCPYGHELVPEQRRTKVFNSAFYI
ncbi:uncharacterized protein LOC106180630 [Lingula anatina]|uniref:Uncharacterized protein LOC106180630 n=1 Tax=Lingula anatina TaxID=7574 RepID=A0A1S3KCF0_LINAN|nr:uncharacterized protein LOC106180630 [Lingula anatina]|eukprot:XP_013420114.1 uncharacterized protein LOC106180630 [Lingula anatina]